MRIGCYSRVIMIAFVGRSLGVDNLVQARCLESLHLLKLGMCESKAERE